MKNIVQAVVVTIGLAVCCAPRAHGSALDVVVGAASLVPTAINLLTARHSNPAISIPQLNELLAEGDIAQLTDVLRAELRNNKSPCQRSYRTWIKDWRFAAPPIEYLYFRYKVSGIEDLQGGIDNDEAQSTLCAMYRFCLHYYIDAVLCMRAAKHASTAARRVKDVLTMLTSMRDNFNLRYAGIHERVTQKLSILMRSMNESGVVDEKLQFSVIHDYTTRLRLARSIRSAHNVSWVLSVHRDDSMLHGVLDTMRSYQFGARLLGNPAGGLVFAAPHEAQLALLHGVEDATLTQWYCELYTSLLAFMGAHIRDWDQLFEGTMLRTWFEEQVDSLKPERVSSSEGGTVVTGRRSPVADDAAWQTLAASVEEEFTEEFDDRYSGAAGACDSSMSRVGAIMSNLVVSNSDSFHAHAPAPVCASANPLEARGVVATSAFPKRTLSSHPPLPASLVDVSALGASGGSLADKEAELLTSGHGLPTMGLPLSPYARQDSLEEHARASAVAPVQEGMGGFAGVRAAAGRQKELSSTPAARDDLASEDAYSDEWDSGEEDSEAAGQGHAAATLESPAAFLAVLGATSWQ